MKLITGQNDGICRNYTEGGFGDGGDSELVSRGSITMEDCFIAVKNRFSNATGASRGVLGYATGDCYAHIGQTGVATNGSFPGFEHDLFNNCVLIGNVM